MGLLNLMSGFESSWGYQFDGNVELIGTRASCGTGQKPIQAFPQLIVIKRGKGLDCSS